MKTLPQNLFLVALALAVFGATSFADLGAKIAAPSGGGSGFGKSRVPVPMWLGVAIAEAPMETSGRLPIQLGTGLLVNEVIAGSPAAIAGLQRGDVLARLNEQTLVTPKQLQTLVMRRELNDRVEITFFRKGERRKVTVVLQPRERM